MSVGANSARAEARADFGWDHEGLAGLAARFADSGGVIVEIDTLTGSAFGTGRGGLPNRHLVFPPYDYVRAILNGGLEIEGEAAERIASASLAGGADFDYAPTLDVFDPRFNAGPGPRLRVRTLDRLLEKAPQPKLLLFGGPGVSAEMLAGGRETLAGGRAIVVARPNSLEELHAFAAALHEVAPAYEWVAPTSGGIGGGARPYYIACVAGRNDAFAPGARRPTLAAQARALASFRATPDMFLASSGFYPVERVEGFIWRWGGALARLSILLEAPAPGLYEIRVNLDNVVLVAGAIEGISNIRVNGTLLANVPRPTQAGFTATARVVRPMLLEIDCSVRRIVPPDPRLLSLSVTSVSLVQVAD